MAHHNVVFPIKWSKGSEAGPEFPVLVTRSVSGVEQRLQRLAAPVRRIALGAFIQSPADAIALQNFFHARGGRLHSFDFRDFTNFQMTDQNIGTGDGATTAFQLRRFVGDAGSPAAYENIYRPDQASTVIPLAVKVNGVPATISSVSTSGVVTLAAAPAAATAVTASCEFYYPVRFDDDAAMQAWGSINSRDLRRITLVTVHPAEL
jgi:uncharacterized protein (TIGR02217 family)